jgi:anthranilate synthase component I
MAVLERPDISADPLTLFRRLRGAGFRILLHTPSAPGWSYLVRPGAVTNTLPPAMPGTHRDEGPPLRAGWIVLMSYETGARFERVSAPADGCASFPDVIAIETETVLAFDHATRKWWSAPGDFEVPYSEEDAVPPCANATSRAIATSCCARDDLFLRSSCRAEDGQPSVAPTYEVGVWAENPSREEYERMAARAREYIAAGDIFQVNLARWFEAEFEGDAFGLFEELVRRNPSPYAAYLELENVAGLPPTAIVSNSPELLFQVEGTRIVTRPIAGTYARSRRREDLPRDPKERAEHIMLIDLERNDLGRLAVPGSVKVEELLGIEEYSHLYHIVSQVAAELRPEVTLEEIVRAVFPGGTITGAPKIRAMQIISELEPLQRGLYTGAIGFVDRSGVAAFNIVIRTATVQEGVIRLAAGAGIVADSDPAREAAETEVKAAAFLETAGASKVFLPRAG